MANPEHVEVVKQGAEAIAKWREEHPEEQLDLSEATLGRVVLDRADLSRANLRGAHMREVRLTGANLAGADLRYGRFFALNGANLSQAILFYADLSGAILIHSNLSGARLRGASLSGARLHNADLSEANLEDADLRYAKLTGAILLGTNFSSANLWGTEFPEVRGADQAFGLNDAYAATCQRRFPERWLDWECLRVVGGLPLFGISYIALILIPIVFYGLALYNDKVELMRAWAEQIVALPDHPLHRLAPPVLARLYPRPIPSLSFLLLISTVLLATGSTLYTFFCTSRIKEFSRDQWCDELGRSLLDYWPLAWKHRYIRLACAACYALGGAGALWVLGTKVWHTALFIWHHSTWSWW